jgi:hypothetical protein
MKTMDFSVLSGSASADPPNWLLLLVWAAVVVVLLVCTTLVALVLVRWLRLWRRSCGSFNGSWPLGLAPLDDLERHPRYVRDQQDPLITQEEIVFLNSSDSSSGDMLP